MKATINSLPMCPWCVRAKKLLDAFEIGYTEINEKSDQWPTVPYIVIDGTPVGGFQELTKFLRGLSS